jgi:acetyl-CoA decarbonylase/synthase complex subunit gamma
MQATPEMRRVRFGLADRLPVVPLDLVMWGRYLVPVLAVLFLLGGLCRGGYDTSLAVRDGGRAAILVLLAYVGGAALVPALLPWLPGRAFAAKGAAIGLLLAVCTVCVGWVSWDGVGDVLEAVSWFLILPAVAAFLAMNFTGASTYTSLSGVRREMRVAVPAQIVAAAVGLGLWIAARFFTLAPATAA